MAKRSSTLARYAQRSRAARAERTRQLIKLRSIGLVSKKANLKSPKVRAGLFVKYRDVIQRKAAVVTVPKALQPKTLKKSFRVSGVKVVIPHAKGERVRVEKTGRITSTRKIKGEKVKRILSFGTEKHKARKGKKLIYAVPFTGGQRVRNDSLEELQVFMARYEFPKGNYNNWRDYMEIEEVDAGDDIDELEDE